MKLPEKVALKELSQILSAKQLWKELIEISFLSSNAKESYLNLLEERLGILLKNFSD